jgi:hypothetical protein
MIKLESSKTVQKMDINIVNVPETKRLLQRGSHNQKLLESFGALKFQNSTIFLYI